VLKLSQFNSSPRQLDGKNLLFPPIDHVSAVFDLFYRLYTSLIDVSFPCAGDEL
jgi:hypothetical protein